MRLLRASSREVKAEGMLYAPGPGRASLDLVALEQNKPCLGSKQHRIQDPKKKKNKKSHRPNPPPAYNRIKEHRTQFAARPCQTVAHGALSAVMLLAWIRGCTSRDPVFRAEAGVFGLPAQASVGVAGWSAEIDRICHGLFGARGGGVFFSIWRR